MMNTIAPTSRDEALARLTEEPLDVLVLGGGIVGSGVVRDAAMRGLRVGLVEQHDFAGGTSSRSSRLLHGGLRYLEQGRLLLVHEASVEKKILGHIAPHLADPLAFIFPAYRGIGRPKWQLGIGVKIYDLLCAGKNFGPSSTLSRDETLGLVPSLDGDRLTGAVRYFDALTNDARLVLDTLRSAARHGAAVCNYVQFHDARREGDFWLCELMDQHTGKSLTVRSRTLVNATGPWAQQVRHSAVKLRLSKGIHIVVDRSRLPVPDAVVLTEGKRILFVIPWGERVIIGTTDTDYEGAPEDVAVAQADIDYVLHAVNERFPSVALTQADIVSTWAGLRPLIANPDGSPSDISRAHQIRCPEPAWWDVAGGKLTTYRLMGEQVVDQIIRHLGCQAAPCRTAVEPLLAPDEAPHFSGTLPPECNQKAVAHYLQNEWAIHLADIMVRRSGWHYYQREPSRTAEQVVAWMAELAGWSAVQQQREVATYQAMTHTAHCAAMS